MALIEKLTAIATAIRGKTGKTAELTLEQMATEIDEMTLGPQVVTGTFLSGSGNYNFDDTLTVSGLPFKPINIIAYAKEPPLYQDYKILYLIDTLSGNVVCSQKGQGVDGSSSYPITIQDNGFTIKNPTIFDPATGSLTMNAIAGKLWYYIAIG